VRWETVPGDRTSHIKCQIFRVHRRTQGFTTEGVHVVRGRARGSGDGSPPVGSRGKAPVGGPEAEAKCDISIQFLTFSCIKFWI